MTKRKDAAEYLNQLDRALEEWGKYCVATSLEELQSDLNKGKKAFYALLVALQAAIDIADCLITEQGLRKPSAYGEAFEILSEEAVLPHEVADALADLAGFRYAIAHLYGQMEPEQLCHVLQKNFPYMQQFRARAAELL